MANHCGSIEDFQGRYYIEGKKDLQRDVIRITYLGEFEVSNEKEIEVHAYPALKEINILGNGLYTGRVTLTYTPAGNH
ncbi:hypothetical protein [Cardinium endosymbiont of Oedothorax gibbosus]|uniref:hypothetical protein n=1 Tax=Cardinium endosymbiont of Oedothorax gibbosus TaxID=931101 RepID=UPI0020256B06|nr:hypothetical protein [Cardinium endosymbiont of Oedothorax gibbosus]